jgi:simple sugar transport system ATP-binding protein
MGPSAPAAALSGGNRQRLLIARAMAGDPRVIVAHDVCRGLDPRAVAEFHQRLREYAAAGGAVLLISGDLDEIFALCGRIHVLSRGRLHAVAPADRDPARLGLLMSGVTR